MIYTLKSSPFSSHRLLLDALPSAGKGERILDVGCGNGYLAKRFADRGYKVVGVERSGGYTDALPDKFELIEADLEAGLPASLGQFDYIVCGDVLEHVSDPHDLLRHLRTLLRSGGLIVASLPNSGNIWFRVNVLLGRFPQDEKGLFDRTHLHFYTWVGWVDLFRSAGLTFVGVQPTSIPVGLVIPSADGSLLVRLAESVCYRLACAWKTLFAYQFVVRAQPEV